ncbi:MAG: A24 family peptidase [Syntrophales bacterium]|nr:A24 family peptidase [Syntrophales bacterium]MDD5640325.1 A24 family peptidase [Syntrophales bacterium]
MAVQVLVFLVGLSLGSFLNVVITRLPLEERAWAGRSRCPHCLTPLPWRDNLPLVSFFLLRRRCRFCAHPISWRYPAVELAGGLLALALWARFPHSYLLLVYGPFSAALVVLTALDLEHRWLPDVITLPGLGLGLVFSLIFPHLAFWQALAGALLGGGVFYFLGWGYEKLTGKMGMGGGDVKLMAMIGAFLGFRSVPLVILLSAALGSLVGLAAVLISGTWRQGGWRTTAIPYGPFLAGAALVYLLGGRELFTWWLAGF